MTPSNLMKRINSEMYTTKMIKVISNSVKHNTTKKLKTAMDHKTFPVSKTVVKIKEPWTL
jgi:hypothetical protein